MNVRTLSAQPPALLALFRLGRGWEGLKSLEKLPALGSPKAKVTGSTPVGCASIIRHFRNFDLTENSRCHHSVTDNFKLAKAARGSFF